MEQQTVEYTFEGEEVSSVTSEHATTTLYRRPDGTYFVYLDARKVADNAVLETGERPRGLTEREVRVVWPELLEAQSGQ